MTNQESTQTLNAEPLRPNYRRARAFAEHYAHKYGFDDEKRYLKKGITTAPHSAGLVTDREGIRIEFISLKDFANAERMFYAPSGILEVNEAENDVVIYIENTENGRRQNFTIAHELGHYFLEHWKNKETYGNFIYRTTDEERNAHPFEKEANCFAANLLMPENCVRAVIQARRNLPSLVDFGFLFGVSGEAFRARCSALKLDDFLERYSYCVPPPLW